MTDIDSVTQIPSRAALDVELPGLWSAAQSFGQPFALFIADIDKFKQVNDKHGHPKGDEVLRAVAQTLSRIVEGKGRVFRYGGEEFLVALPNYDQEEAISLAERARRSIAESQHAGLSITASFGIAVAGVHAADLAAITKNADGALYDAKKRGRDLVRVSGDPEPPIPDRKPARRAPTPGGFTEDEMALIREVYFVDRHVRCPRDSAVLSIQEIPLMAYATPMLMARCKLCGTSGRSDAA